jgi:hypothetical protein
VAAAPWPELDLRAWAPTKKSLHLYAQMLGKLRLALSPDQPNWMFVRLLLNARGFTTGPMPWGQGSLEASLDVSASQMRVACSDGRSVEIALLPPRTVAVVFAEFRAALAALSVNVTLSPVPQEVPDLTPLDQDHRDAAYDPAAVQRWFEAVTAIAGAFDRWRAHFFGRTEIQLWWGAFDVALLLFSGKKVPAPADRGYLMRYDLDAEMMNVGFYPGDDASPAPFFYGYIYPQPARCESARIAPDGASWSTQLGEWVLPYDAVRSAADPAALLHAFCDAVYEVCGGAAGWDRAAHVYDHPKRR